MLRTPADLAEALGLLPRTHHAVSQVLPVTLIPKDLSPLPTSSGTASHDRLTHMQTISHNIKVR